MATANGSGNSTERWLVSFNRSELEQHTKDIALVQAISSNDYILSVTKVHPNSSPLQRTGKPQILLSIVGRQLYIDYQKPQKVRHTRLAP